MTLHLRRTLFYVLSLAFLLVGTSVVLYAQGWRLDMTSLRLSKVGAMYIRSFPPNAQIFLNEKPIKNRAWLLQNGTFINNLFPKTYTLSLTLPGFLPWQQEIQVRSSLVTEVKFAVLVPENPEETLTGPLNAYHLVRGEFVTEDATSTLIWRGRALPGDEVLGWTDDGKRLLSRDTKGGRYFWNNLDDYTNIDPAALIRRARTTFSSKTDRLAVDPKDAQKLFVLRPKSFSMFDMSRNQLVPLDREEAPSHLASSRFWIAWTKKETSGANTLLVVYDKFLRTSRSAGVFPSETHVLKFINENEVLLVQANGDLFRYHATRGTLIQIASDAKDFAAYNEGSSIAVLEHSALEVFGPHEENYTRFVLPDQKKTQNIGWFADGMHLFIHYPDRVAFLDIKDKTLKNFVALARTPKGMYDAETNTFYFFKDGDILKLVFAK